MKKQLRLFVTDSKTELNLKMVALSFYITFVISGCSSMGVKGGARWETPNAVGAYQGCYQNADYESVLLTYGDSKLVVSAGEPYVSHFFGPPLLPLIPSLMEHFGVCSVQFNIEITSNSEPVTIDFWNSRIEDENGHSVNACDSGTTVVGPNDKRNVQISFPDGPYYKAGSSFILGDVKIGNQMQEIPKLKFISDSVVYYCWLSIPDHCDSKPERISCKR